MYYFFSIILSMGMLFLASCANVIHFADDVVNYHNEYASSNGDNDPLIVSVKDTIDEVSTPDGYPYGSKGLKRHNRKGVIEINKLGYIKQDDWIVAHVGELMTVATKRKGGMRPLFIIDMPKHRDELSCDEPMMVHEILSLAKELVHIEGDALKPLIPSSGFVSKDTIDTICKKKEKNKFPFLCRNIQDVIDENIRVVAVEVDDDATILKIGFKDDSFYVCKDFIKQSEVFDKRNPEYFAIFKIELKN